MKKQTVRLRKKVQIVFLVAALIAFCAISGRMILNQMEGYIEKNGKNNMATIMEQMVQSYDTQVNEYYRNLEQIEGFLFQSENRAISLEGYQRYFDSIQQEDTQKLLFMKVSGEVLLTDGTKSHIDIQNQMLVDLSLNQRIAQSITMNINSKKGSYYVVAIPCEPYQVDGETYTVLAALYDQSRIDSMLEVNGYGGQAYLFLVDKNGIVNYTNQASDNFYRNYALFKHLRRDKAITDEQYNQLVARVKNSNQKIDLFEENDRPFYLGCHPVKSSDLNLICIVARSAVNNALLEYQKTLVRLFFLYVVIVLLLCAVIIYNVFRANIAGRKAAYEEEKRELQERAMEALAIERNRADEANRAKSEFLSNMSHDIRTPMNAIVGLTDLMMHEKNLSDKMKNYLNKIQSSSRHLLGLINDVLDMSKIESGEVRLNAEAVNLTEILQQVDSIIHGQASKHSQQFQVCVQNVEHENLICDGVRLRQVLLNLLSNAVKYTQDGGTITLKVVEMTCANPNHARFCFEVIDNGYGMKSEFVAHIFEPFVREEQSVTNRVQGTGLGMAITKNIVTMMGGEISVKSEIGKGSEFKVILTFPINQIAKTQRKADVEKETEKETINLAGMRFLCAEDNQLNAEILQELLTMYGASCTIYPNGEAIVEAFQSVKPGDYDAILMDVQMPKKNGLEATTEIRKGRNALGKTIPIIAMTANAFSEDMQHCISAGMNAHIAKPLDICVLEKTLKSLNIVSKPIETQ